MNLSALTAMDASKAAGLLAIGAIVFLGLTKRSFASVSIG